MPTYEYVCEACGHAWEARQSMKDDPLTDCPSCGEPKAKRQISLGAGFILKGGGWYSDLYGNKKAKREAGTPGDRYKDKDTSAGAITSAPTSTPSSTADKTADKTAAAPSTSSSDASTSSSSSSSASTSSETPGSSKSSGSSD
jgi:putative FmdB family regulatory protein